MKRAISLVLSLILAGASALFSLAAGTGLEDVPATAWCAGAVNYAAEKGIMSGTGNIPAPEDITFGNEEIRGFQFDNVYHDAEQGDIHFGMYIPESYDGTKTCSLFVTLPGYEGLYFQGVGINIRSEDFGIEAQKYNEEMIVVAPQLNDWHMTSAQQTVALTKYILAHYNIDPDKVYLEGYSGGGETGSLVMELAPELFTAYLLVSSQWNGDLAPVVESRTPVYLATGENDSYYGSSSVRETFAKLREMYAAQGLSESKINELVVMDLKPQSYFDERGVRDQHAGGGLFAHDEEIMGWLFGEHPVSRTSMVMLP